MMNSDLKKIPGVGPDMERHQIGRASCRERVFITV